MRSATLTVEEGAAKGGPLIDRSSAIQWLVAGVTLFLVVLPLLPIFYQAFLDKPLYYPDAHVTFGNFGELLDDPDFPGVLANTAYFAALMTIVSQGMGVVSAILVGRTDLPGRRFFADVLLWPLFISHLVLAFGWFLMFGPAGYITLGIQLVTGEQPWDLYTLTGMGVVGGLAQAPLAYLYCLGVRDVGRRLAGGCRAQRRRRAVDGAAAHHPAADDARRSSTARS